MSSSLVLLRRAASKRATVAAVSSSIDALLHHHHGTNDDISNRTSVICADLSHTYSLAGWLGRGLVRSFHCPAPLNFMVSAPLLRAQYAMDEISGEDNFSSSVNRPNDEGLEISKLGISDHIVKALASKGITKLFPIQKAVLEPAMQGRDMIGRARTGTGKTLAFGIPIMDKIIRFNEKHGRGRNPLALVLAPTRELARQVDKEFYEAAGLELDTLCVYGGVPISQQISKLDHGQDVVVGTPGRVIDLIKRGALNLSEVQFLVLDEADQMLNVGFAEDVETILQHLPMQRQSMMFSATMPSWIRKLTVQYLKNPLTIDLVGDSDKKLPDGISLYSIASEVFEKSSIIGPLIMEHAKGGKCIVFTQTKRDADRLSYAMSKNFKCEALHGDISQNQRERTLSGFRDGYFNVLVATDVAARGLDVPNVDLVIHYELPTTSEVFVHRSGRTGRAGKQGTAILIHTSNQFRDVKTIERDVGCKFVELPRIKVEGDSNMINDMGMSRFGSQRGAGGRGFGDPGFGRFSGLGRSSGYDGPSTGRAGGGFGSGSYSGFGSGRFGGSFGDSGSRGSGGFGSGSYTGDRSGRSGGNFGDFNSRGSGRFGDFRSARSSNGFSDSRSSRFDNFDDKKLVGGQRTRGRTY